MTLSAVPEASSPPHLLAVGACHSTAPLALIEKLALSPGVAGRMLAELTSHEAVREAAALSTCNRTELYLVVTDVVEGEGIALTALGRAANVPPAALLGRLRSLRQSSAVRHLFRVTAGLESIAVGEAEIQGQVKRAYELARLEGVTGPITNRLFRGALEAGKRARSASCRPRVSVASLAVGLAARELGCLEGRRALVIGSGENGELTGRALAERGARTVFVANRHYERAQALAGRLGGRAVRLPSLRKELVDADLAICCTSSPNHVLAPRQLATVMEQRGGRALLLIDSAVPRDVAPAVGDLPQVTLYDIEELKREAAADASARATGAVRTEPLIEHEVERFQAWLASLDVVPAISALREHAEAAVQGLLRENTGCWESPSPRDRERVAMVAQTVANRFLHEPTTRLKRAAASDVSTAYVEALRELFGWERAAPGANGPALRDDRPEPAVETAG
jgi:glutamyl-tRNA reductase